MKFLAMVLLAVIIWLPIQGTTAVRVLDDAGRMLELEKPAQRIISLAPYLTELLFAAGAGSQVVGVSAFSNYPEQALSLPIVSAGTGLDVERIVALQPDLVVAWKSGNPATQVEQLERLGLKVFYSEPREIDAIADTIQRVGLLAGHVKQANAAAGHFREQVLLLRNRFQNKKTLSVFYQVWQKPLMTVNGQHMISHWLALCGGKNIFAGLTALVPVVDIESVLVANPLVIVSGGYTQQDSGWREYWQRWPVLAAVRKDNLLSVPAEIMDRQTPRSVIAARELCEKIERARKKMY